MNDEVRLKISERSQRDRHFTSIIMGRRSQQFHSQFHEFVRTISRFLQRVSFLRSSVIIYFIFYRGRKKKNCFRFES